MKTKINLNPNIKTQIYRQIQEFKKEKFKIKIKFKSILFSNALLIREILFKIIIFTETLIISKKIVIIITNN
jgi:hypothetical protein